MKAIQLRFSSHRAMTRELHRIADALELLTERLAPEIPPQADIQFTDIQKPQSVRQQREEELSRQPIASESM